MIKVSLYSSSEEYGPAAVPLFGAADSYFEKTASATLLPEVSAYIAQLKPRNDSQYVLVNAMGAGEYYGSNVNGDRFSEAALTHCPPGWRGVPVTDAVLAHTWAYGFPTFYDARVFPHHRNRDATKALGFVELAAWNPHMKRVELVTRLDYELCQKFGGASIWDKIKTDGFPDVSMGTKVPFDTCSITLDKALYQRAWDTFDPKRHRSPGDAILEFHKKLKARDGVGIRGLSITRSDYSDYARTQMNVILPDGRKVWVDNDFPKFFDISFVFIGADKIAKSMLKIARLGRVYSCGAVGSAELAEQLGAVEAGEKTAGVDVARALQRLFDREESPQDKTAFDKDVIPNQLAGKAVPVLTAAEPDIPRGVLQSMGAVGLEGALSTAASLGIVLRPREYQRLTLICERRTELADTLDALGHLFPATDAREPVQLGVDRVNPALARILEPLQAGRSAFGPAIEGRALVIGAGGSTGAKPRSTSHPSELLRKIGAAYNGYRDSVMQYLSQPAPLTSEASPHKLASDDRFTPLSRQYLATAFYDELPAAAADVVKQTTASVQRALPLVTTRQ